MAPWSGRRAEERPVPVLLTLGILALGILLRGGAFVWSPPLDIDETRYLVVAHHLRSGSGYTNWNGPETHVHPLHPLLTAAAGASLDSLETRGRLVALLASIALLLPVVFLARRLGGCLAAFLALFLAATHPWLVRASARVQPESLYAFLVACAIAILPDAFAAADLGELPRRRLWRSAAAGVLLGLAYLARPEGLLVGLFVCGITLLHVRRAGPGGLRGPALFLLGLLLAAAPYLWFLRNVTGEWTITGKVAWVFFVDQSLHEARDPLEAPDIHDEMMRRYGGVLAYALDHPGRILAAALKNGAHVAFSILPRMLGPLGLLGLFAFALGLARKTESPSRWWLVVCPCLTLGLLLCSFPNDRVAGTTLPFLLLPASSGLAAILRGPLEAGDGWRRRALLGTVFLAMALSGWGPAVARVLRHPAGAPRGVIRREGSPVDEVLARAGAAPGGTEGFVTNDVVLSFHARDPLMFGPSGRYRSFRFDTSCAEIVSLLKETKRWVAVLSVIGASADPASLGPACPLILYAQIDDPSDGRSLRILVLPQEQPRSRRVGPGDRNGGEGEACRAPRRSAPRYHERAC